MSENAKTMTFVVVGLVAILIGIVTAPSVAELDENSLVGTNLTSKFQTPEVAKRLRIVRFDQDTATPREFEVAEQNGLWTIPSKEGYPADAARQMGEAANSLMERKILGVVTSNAGEHEQYGVLDPMTPKLEPGQKGVGTRVTMSDEEGKPIADLIVGKGVRDAEKQRFVRVAGQDFVYIIEIDPAKLSTNFEDWIEKDLLQLQAWDLQQVQIKDYSAELVQVMSPDGPAVGINRDDRSEMTLGYNDAEAKWNSVKLRSFDRKKGENGEYVDFSLAKDEELNEESLNGLKNALGDLKIVDVVRKPHGLSQDLKAGDEFIKNRDAKLDLMLKGFTAASAGPNTPQEIISNDGEVIATTKNGTQYVLRFGNLRNAAGGGQDKEEKAQAKDAKADAKDKDKKADKGDVDRYLFVMAQFDESAVKQPELQKLPELPAKTEVKTDQAGASTAAPAKPTEGATPKAGEKPADAQPPSDKEDAAKAKEGVTQPPAKKDKAAKKDEASAKKEDASAKKTDEAPAKKEEGSAKKDEAAAKNAPSQDKDVEKIIAERKRIETENQRKLDEYQALVKKGQENVKKLNLRFGDWYFVVNDDVFRKIRLSRDKVVKKKEKPKAVAAPGQADKIDGAGPSGIPGLPAIPGANK